MAFARLRLAARNLSETCKVEVDMLLERDRLVAVERIVLVVVVAQTLFARHAVEVERHPLARDPDPARVVRVGEHLLEARHHLGQRGDPMLLAEAVQTLEHLVHALADESLDRLGLGRDLPQVAVLELARARLERGQPRVAVHVAPDRPLAVFVHHAPRCARR
jgi:hypothetical protein